MLGYFVFLDSLCQFCTERGVFCWLSQEMEGCVRLLSNFMTPSPLDYLFFFLHTMQMCHQLWLKFDGKREGFMRGGCGSLAKQLCVCLSTPFSQNNYNQKCLNQDMLLTVLKPFFLTFVIPLFPAFSTLPRTSEIVET